ncbi:hypothetical protein SAMN02745945_00394 [Peptoclostridium litorale DSM 5388]|uniref:DUF2127 domain-containing protein n=1 Tax=Peptoclostridium litorale DSM 5388 TaxID=1121324 RepID=A0A069RGE5_PEPLI|nr:hypothetical protein [Peptoclostridium litorale]KDR95235.1 hypothetical protein CLIT_11c02640 [Peptoclostridium litorale DSM 5388]SIN72966.1 hypothetical protein SAMN02745945_00394 [Peptoclostridium litorale DSM 5388]
MAAKRTKGFWIIMIMGKLLLLILIVGQMMAFINYDFTVSLGLQESKDIIGEMGVAVNKGFGVGDTIIYTPILAIGLIGLWLRKMWGVIAMTGALAITAYWPMVSIFILIYAKNVPGFNFTNYASYSILLSAITIYGIWGMWYLYKNRKILAYEE